MRALDPSEFSPVHPTYDCFIEDENGPAVIETLSASRTEDNDTLADTNLTCHRQASRQNVQLCRVTSYDAARRRGRGAPDDTHVARKDSELGH